jgi:malate dehydrogenase (oxaloacetate-decarboxylating)(NADP+)
VIGPILTGLDKPVKLTTTTATVNDVLNMAVMAACRVG